MMDEKSNLNFPSCEFRFENTDHCNVTGKRNECNRISIPVQAASNFRDEYEYLSGSVSLRIESAIATQILNLAYTVTTLPSPECHILPRGQIVDFKNKLLTLRDDGVYQFHSSVDGFHVQVALRSSASFPFERSICGIAAENANGIGFSLDNCAGWAFEYSDRVEVFKTLNDTVIVIEFPCGRRLRIDLVVAGAMKIGFQGVGQDSSRSAGACAAKIRNLPADESLFRKRNLSGEDAFGEINAILRCNCLNSNCVENSFRRSLVKMDEIEKSESRFKTVIDEAAFIKSEGLFGEEEAINSFCTNSIVNSTIAIECGRFFDRDIMAALRVCHQDLSSTNKSITVLSSLSLLASQCEFALIRKSVDANNAGPRLIEALNTSGYCSPELISEKGNMK